MFVNELASYSSTVSAGSDLIKTSVLDFLTRALNKQDLSWHI